MNKVLIVLFITLVFLLPDSKNAIAYEKEINAIASTLADNISTSGKKSIAVVDFTDLQGNVTELGRFLSEEFSVALSESGKRFEVVDRSQLNSILKEQQFTLSGLVDPKTVQKIGAIAGVQCLVTGTLTPFGDSIRLSVKVLDTSTARVIGGSRGDIAKTKAIEELLARGVESVPIIGVPQAPPSPRVPPPSGLKTKTVGNITVSVKKILISKEQLIVALDFFNRSNKELKVIRNCRVIPGLLDDKGNRYNYDSGISETCPEFGETDKIRTAENSGTTLYAQSGNDVVLSFKPSRWDINIRDIGSIFEFSLSFMVYDPKDKTISVHQLSLSDIKAQVPR
ncbi:MAG: FlgO family outer membrane protein [Pseudomonadota bacterium]